MYDFRHVNIAIFKWSLQLGNPRNRLRIQDLNPNPYGNYQIMF